MNISEKLCAERLPRNRISHSGGAGVVLYARKLRHGFTLIEMLVVISIISILAGLVLPAIGGVKRKAQGIQCMSNLKQLGVGWTLYPGDHSESLMVNTSTRSVPWVCKDYLTWGNDAINTNTAILLNSAKSAMADYVHSAGVYKCPGDNYQSTENPGPRVRSVSMNGSLDGKPQFINKNGRTYFTARKLSQLSTPGPDKVFVFLDEHADSIDDGCFMVDPGYAPGSERWRNLPASYHGGAGAFAFADGHAEIHRWLEQGGDNKTVYPVRKTGNPTAQPWNSGGLQFTSRDYEWIEDRMPYRIH